MTDLAPERIPAPGHHLLGDNEFAHRLRPVPGEVRLGFPLCADWSNRAASVDQQLHRRPRNCRVLKARSLVV